MRIYKPIPVQNARGSIFIIKLKTHKGSAEIGRPFSWDRFAIER